MTNDQKAAVWAEKLTLQSQLTAAKTEAAKAEIKAKIEHCNQQLIQDKLEIASDESVKPQDLI